MTAIEPMFSVSDLTIDVATSAGMVPVVNGVSFAVHRGEVLGIVGESGSGKSISMLAAMGLLAAPAARVSGGTIRLAGRDLLTATPAEMAAIRGRDLAMIFQEPMTSLNPVLTIGRQIEETIRIHNPGIGRQGARARAGSLLGMVGVSDPPRRLRQYPHEFSGGMRQRVMIAVAIANDPALLIADEPTTALDVTIQAQVMDVLAQARQRTGSAMILVTHDLGLVAEHADRVAVMYGGRIVETGTVAELFAQPRHPYTIGLLRSLPRLDAPPRSLRAIPGQPPGLERPGGCIFHPRCDLGSGRPICASEVPPLAALSATHASACHFVSEMSSWPAATDSETAGAGATDDEDAHHAGGQQAAAAPVLHARDLRTQFRVRRPRGFGHEILHAVNGVSFAIARAETFGLVGESGCGKSTLARTILGLHRTAGGTIHVNGRNLLALSSRQRRAAREEMQVVFQDPYGSLDPRMDAHEIVAEPLRINGGYQAARVLELLDQVGLPRSAALRRPAQFSGGQRQRIAIARALALRPHLIILDEAVSALDVSIQAQVLNLLKQLQRDTGVSYLFISHNLAVVRHMADTVAVMYLGRIVEMGRRSDLFDAPLHPYTQALLAAIPVPDPAAAKQRRRIILAGELANPLAPPSGCGFRNRCWKAAPLCGKIVPELSPHRSSGHLVACHFAETTPDTPGLHATGGIGTAGNRSLLDGPPSAH